MTKKLISLEDVNPDDLLIFSPHVNGLFDSIPDDVPDDVLFIFSPHVTGLFD